MKAVYDVDLSFAEVGAGVSYESCSRASFSHANSSCDTSLHGFLVGRSSPKTITNDHSCWWWLIIKPNDVTVTA